MGGGGGGSWFSTDEIKKVEESTKKKLADNLGPSKRNIFISFDSDDLDSVNLLRGQAKNKNNELEFNDYSVKEPYNSEQAEYIQRKIRERIRQSSATVVFLSNRTAGSEWVDWEIRESSRQGKRIVAMYQGDTPPKRLPKALGELGIKPISWSHEGLMSALE
jgi:hypothetical protein